MYNMASSMQSSTVVSASSGLIGDQESNEIIRKHREQLRVLHETSYWIFMLPVPVGSVWNDQTR
jgi:hypothetical protein